MKPLVPTEAIQALRSDSRLDPRSNPALYSELGKASGGASVYVSPPLESNAVHTQLSGAARFLSELFHGHARSAPVIRPAAPLLPAGDQSAENLAFNLQRTVENSGLFYESHLLRSYQGKWDWGKLPAELQMTLQHKALPSISDHLNNEAMRGLLRQQFELLAVPQLRWDGDAWPGLHLEIRLEYQQIVGDVCSNSSEGEQKEHAEHEDAAVWQADLTLALPNLGKLAVQLHLRGDSLKLIVVPASEVAEDLVTGWLAELRDQLTAIGLSDIQLIVGTINEG
ncbi:flagellar hook-length control protein FliK [Microbulbifer sp. SA54]|uniref:flagellar hook-length control protein FliK n=1 Tax=Microbulbifer sp. SA54 TaxID=3401577 RepID=UPI003AAB84DA